MILKNSLEIDNAAINKVIKRLVNQIYKLLPGREEGLDWRRPLESLIEEISGMRELFIDEQDILFTLLCKMKGMLLLIEEEDFSLYRRTVFECLSLLHDLEV